MKENLESFIYQTKEEFDADIELTIQNAITFNPVGATVHNDALALKSYFDREWHGIAEPPRATKAPSKTTATPSFSIMSLIPELRQCHQMLGRIEKHASAGPFLFPVDPIALNIPNYFDVVKNPMDLGTVKKRLEGGAYSTHYEFKADVDLVLQNCFTFNQPFDWVYGQGKLLEDYVKKEWEHAFGIAGQFSLPASAFAPEPVTSVSRAPAPRVESTNRMLNDEDYEETIQFVIDELRAHPDAVIFLEPVDPNVYPDYYRKIKQPIDLSATQAKLDEGKYSNYKQFDSDIELMFANCFKFNAKKTVGHALGLSTEKLYQSLRKMKFGSSAPKSTPKKTIAIKMPTAPKILMPAEDQKMCYEIINTLVNHPYARPFSEPVPKTVPNYHVIIQKPMDFGTIKKKIKNEYSKKSEFFDDVTQVFINCRMYNAPVILLFLRSGLD